MHTASLCQKWALGIAQNQSNPFLAGRELVTRCRGMIQMLASDRKKAYLHSVVSNDPRMICSLSLHCHTRINSVVQMFQKVLFMALPISAIQKQPRRSKKELGGVAGFKKLLTWEELLFMAEAEAILGLLSPLILMVQEESRVCNSFVPVLIHKTNKSLECNARGQLKVPLRVVNICEPPSMSSRALEARLKRTEVTRLDELSEAGQICFARMKAEVSRRFGLSPSRHECAAMACDFRLQGIQSVGARLRKKGEERILSEYSHMYRRCVLNGVVERQVPVCSSESAQTASARSSSSEAGDEGSSADERSTSCGTMSDAWHTAIARQLAARGCGTGTATKNADEADAVCDEELEGECLLLYLSQAVSPPPPPPRRLSLVYSLSMLD